jgi:hypothetical protein
MVQILSFAEKFLIWILLVVMLAIYLLLLVRLNRILKVRADRHHTMELRNEGNLPSVYQLAISSPERQLDFTLFHEGMSLIDVPESPQTESLSPVEPKPAFQPQSPAVAPHPVEAPKKPAAAPPQQKSGKSSLDKASKQGQGAVSKLGVVAGFLGTLGSLLPGKLGRQLTSKGAAARDTQASALKTIQAPKQIQRKTDALQSQSGRLGAKRPQNAQTPESTPNAVAVPAPGAEQSNLAAAQTAPTHPARISAEKPPPVREVYRVQTREVAPGARLPLVLQIGSKGKRYPRGSFAYTIQSKQMPLTPTKIEPPLLSKHGTVYFKPIAAWRYGLPFLVTSAILLLTLLSTFYYLLLI